MIDVGSVIGNKYRLLRLVGEGGMGAVYEAEHMGLGASVAIKVLHPELARRAGLVERFLQEARVAAQIRSPHVVHVADVDRTPEGQAYIVMELLEGEPLSAALQRERRLPVAVACEYAAQILDALEVAARARRRPPRPQARERVRHHRGRQAGPQAHRLRHRQGPARRDREEPHGRRVGHGHRRVHGARAGAERRRRSTRAPTSTRWA